MINLSDCIEFTGFKHPAGYGQISKIVNGKVTTFKAHRIAWAEVHGPIPGGMYVCHKCDNPPCINVDHLFLGTPADNVRDMMNKGRNKAHKGSDHSQSKLTEQDIPRIRDMLRMGCTLQAIGDWFGVSYGTISNIKRGKNWTHVA